MISSAASAASAASKEQRWKTKIIEDYDSEGRNLLTQKGFDHNNVHQERGFRDGIWTPLTYFCRWGYFKMVRYLVARGADSRQANNVGYFPMYYAAAHGHVEIVRFLAQDGGAHADIQRQNLAGTSPLRIALREDHLCVAKLLIRNDALASRDDVAGGGIDDVIMRRDLRQEEDDEWGADKREAILAWAQEAVTNQEHFKLFLKGTIDSRPPPPPKPYYATRSQKRRKRSSSSPLVELRGKAGILKLVADYVGYPPPHELRLFRKLLERLPPLIAAVPFVDNYKE